LCGYVFYYFVSFKLDNTSFRPLIKINLKATQSQQNNNYQENCSDHRCHIFRKSGYTLTFFGITLIRCTCRLNLDEFHHKRTCPVPEHEDQHFSFYCYRYTYFTYFFFNLHNIKYFYNSSLNKERQDVICGVPSMGQLFKDNENVCT